MSTATPTVLTTAQERSARAAARAAYLRSPYCSGRTHDWQDAEVACCSHLMNRCGLSNDEAYEVGRLIAADVVSEIEQATPEQPF